MGGYLTEVSQNVGSQKLGAPATSTLFGIYTAANSQAVL
jgi:hypothetical protein